MENWRKYQNEMRDRYLAPGEDPMDASIEDEELHMHISDKTGEIIDTIFQSPHHRWLLHFLYLLKHLTYSIDLKPYQSSRNLTLNWRW